MSHDISEVHTSFDMNAMRQHLLKTAIPYAESLRNRQGLSGILLYGSLVRVSLTPFSDIDMTLIYDCDPPYAIEHRKVNREKVDLISFTFDDMKKHLDPLPRSLDAGFPFSYVLESLLLADNESILYDPTGEILRMKRDLNEKTSFQALNRVSLNDGYYRFYKANLKKTDTMYKQGDMASALKKAKWCGEALAFLLKSFTVLKDTREASVKLEIIEFDDKREELVSISAPSTDKVEAVFTSTQALWDYTMKSTTESLEQTLRSYGVSNPDSLELSGDYGLFWPGENLYEYGRLMEEVNFSLRWCRYDLNNGKGSNALKHLWACKGTQGIRERWERLSFALKDTGYDCSSIIEGMLGETDFALLGMNLDASMKDIELEDVTPDSVNQALRLVDEMEQILIRAIPLLTEDEL